MSWDDTLTAIRQVIRGDLLLPSQGGQVTIQELDPGATLRSIRVIDLCHEAVAVKFDAAGQTSAVFANGTPARRACDAIVFCRLRDSSPCVLFCELKSSQPANRSYQEQMVSAECFVEYLRAVLRAFHPAGAFPPAGNVTKRFVLFYSRARTLTKRPTRPTLGQHDSARRALHVQVANGQGVYLRRIL